MTASMLVIALTSVQGEMRGLLIETQKFVSLGIILDNLFKDSYGLSS